MKKFREVFCALYLILNVLNNVEAEVRISLQRQKSPRELMWEKDVTESHLKLFKPNKDNDSIALYKYLDSDFYGILRIGHPGQEFNVVFDTAWADSWVISKYCSYFNAGCWLHHKYDSDHSSSYIENGIEFQINETNGQIKGFLSTDTFKMGHTNVTNQTFAEVSVLPWLYLFSKTDGVVGLAFHSLSKYNYSCFFENLFLQNRIKKPIFSIYFNRDKTTSHAGDLLLGAMDPKHYFNDTLFFLPVTQPAYYWQFKMSRIVMNGTKKSYPFCANGCQAAIDTSTKIIIGPPKEIKYINNKIGATTLYYNRYVIPCNLVPKLPKMQFVIGDRNFTLHGEDIAQQVSNSGLTMCFSIFVPSNLPKDESNIWFLGVAFLERVYTVYDYGKQMIGFAKAR